MPAVVVRLVTADLALLARAIDDRPALGRALGCEVADGWDVFPGALLRTRVAVAADPASTRWGARLFVLDEPPTLVGWGGFKGPPLDGVVEVGYAVAPNWEGRGLATAAVLEMLGEAFAAPGVQAVIAHTLPEPGPSARVLEKAGFAHEGEVPDEQIGRAWRFRHVDPVASRSSRGGGPGRVHGCGAAVAVRRAAPEPSGLDHHHRPQPGDRPPPPGGDA